MSRSWPSVAVIEVTEVGIEVPTRRGHPVAERRLIPTSFV